MYKRIFLYRLIPLMALVGLLVFAGCKKENNSNFSVNYMYNYYPIDSGHSITYNVDSVNFNYDDGSGVYTRDTNAYQMLAVWGDTIHDLLDSVNFRVYYSTRPMGSSSWGSPYETYGLRTMTNLQINENDLRFVKLVFPPQLNETWNGNEYIGTDPSDPNDPYNVFNNWNYYYENCDTTITIGANTFTNCIIVSEVYNVTLINKIVRTEMYAPKVGMIYQEWDNLSNPGTGSLALGWDTGATSGYTIHMWAVGYTQ